MNTLQTGIAMLVVASVCRTSAAQVSDVPSADAHIQAEMSLKAARSALDAEKYEDAYEAMRQAWALDKTYRTAGNLGLVEMHLGKMREAAEHLQFSLLRFPWREGAEEKMARFEQHLQTAKSHIGTLRLKVDVRDAAVYIDGILVGASPLFELYVNPGRRLLEVSKPGHKPVRKVLPFAAGSEQHLQVTLEPVATAPSAQQAVEIKLGSPQEVKLELKVPPEKVDPLQAKPDAAKPVQPQHPPEEPKPLVRKIVIGAGGTVAGAGLGLGVGMTVAANGAATKAREIGTHVGRSACRGQPVPNDVISCGAIGEAIDGHDRFRDVAVAGYMIGGIATAATLTYVLWPRSKHAESVSAQPVLWLSPKTSGLGIVGRF
jgi:hypothetical protein